MQVIIVSNNKFDYTGHWVVYVIYIYIMKIIDLSFLYLFCQTKDWYYCINYLTNKDFSGNITDILMKKQLITKMKVLNTFDYILSYEDR